LLISECIDS